MLSEEIVVIGATEYRSDLDDVSRENETVMRVPEGRFKIRRMVRGTEKESPSSYASR